MGEQPVSLVGVEEYLIGESGYRRSRALQAMMPALSLLWNRVVRMDGTGWALAE